MLTLGHVLGGRYRLDEEIGSGGMGSVFRGWHLVLDREVAVKVLHPRLAADESFRARFLREPQMAARIRHPNIIGVHDAADDPEMPYIVMDYVSGGDLRRLVRRGRLETAEALGIVTDVAAALDAAHAHGLVHRDVKPANILLGESGVLLTDFGLAKLSSGAADMTRTGIFLGTPYYAAPEQFEGAKASASADVYSLGCVLYECLSGAVPFAYESEFRLGLAHREEQPPRLSDTRPELGTRLDEVVARAMAKRPEDRYPSAGAVAEAARAALGSLRGAETVIAPPPAAEATLIDSRADTRPTTMEPAPKPDVTLGEPEPAEVSRPAPKAPRRVSKRTALIAAAVALVTMAATGAVVAFAGGGGETAAGDPGTTTEAAASHAVVKRPAKPANAFPTRLESTVLTAAGLHAKSCKRAPRLAAFGSAAAVASCTVDGRRLTFGIFPTGARLAAAYASYYAQRVRPAGVGQDRVRCGAPGASAGEGGYALRGREAGRILCFRLGGAAWIVWTRSNPFLLSVAREPGASHAALVSWWSGPGRTQDPVHVVVRPSTPSLTPSHSSPSPSPQPSVPVPQPPSSVDVPEPPS